MSRQPCHRRRVEQVRVILQAPAQPRRGFLPIQRQVEQRAIRLDGDRLQSQTRHRPIRARRVLRREHDLEDRPGARVALRTHRLDQLRERQVLMSVRPARGVAHPAQQFTEGRFARKVHAHRNGVHKETDQPFRLRPVPPEHRRPDHHVVLSRVASDQRMERREERHEQRRVFLTRKSRELSPERLRQIKGMNRSPMPRHRGARTIRGQLQLQRSAREFPPPPVEFTLQRRAIHRPALPRREVRELNRQRRQRRGLPSGEGGVEFEKFLEENLHRPRIRSDVVQHQQQDVLRLRHTVARSPEHQVARQIERAACFDLRQTQRFVLRLRAGSQIDHFQSNRLRRKNTLHRATLPGGEHRPQRLVPRHDLRQCALDDRGLQQTGNPQRRRNIVGG